VLVAQALVHRPPVIVLDEPTAGVDVELRHGLWQFVGRLNRDGHTIVLTTHYLEEAQQMCERIAMLKAGRIVAMEPTRDLLGRLAGVRLALKLRGALPTSLRALVVEETGDHFVLRVSQPAEVESVLATCRAEGCHIDDLEVGHADLEDVFLQVMSDAGEKRAA